MSDEAFSWLAFEGLVPIFGAGVLYLILGVGKWITIRDRASFRYNWRDSLDPIGWLYGGSVVALMTAMKAKAGSSPTFKYACIFCAALCMLLLIAAFHSKADDPEWQPPRMMSWVAGVLVVVILAAGFEVQNLSQVAGVSP